METTEMAHPNHQQRPLYVEISRIRDTAYARVAFTLGLFAIGLMTWALVTLDHNGAGPPVALLSIFAAMALLIPLRFRRETRVDRDSIHLRFDWVGRGKLELMVNDVQDHRVADCPPHSQWSQSPTEDASKIRVLSAGRDKGVIVTMRDGRRIFIASSHPNRFNRAIGTALHRHREVL